MANADELRPIASDNLPTPQRGGASRHSPFPEKLGLAYAEVYARGCPEMPCSIFDFIPACVSGLLFCAASTGIIMLNKWIIASMSFRLPMTLSFLGMAFSFVASLALVKLTDWVPRNVDITPAFALRRALPIGVLIAATLRSTTGLLSQSASRILILSSIALPLPVFGQDAVFSILDSWPP